MRILFLTCLYAPHIGGVETHAHEVARRLATQHRVTVITEQHDAQLPLREVIDNVEVYRIPIGRSRKLSIWLWLLRHMHLLLHAHIIHVHDVFFWMLPFRLPLFWKKIYVT